MSAGRAIKISRVVLARAATAVPVTHSGGKKILDGGRKFVLARYPVFSSALFRFSVR